VRSAAPADPSPTGVEVSVLGPVTLTGATPPDRQAVLELIDYLALHRRGVRAEQLGTALWPESPNGPETCRKRIFDARDCLGGDAIRGRQSRVLDERIGCDWQRFQALAAGGRSEQHQALNLVRGAPFADWTLSEWCSTDGFRAEMTAAIVDLAVSVAGADLDAGDNTVAYDAARAGLRGCRYEERLYRLAIRAALAEGSTGKARAVMAELKAVLDIDISPDDAIEEATLDQYTDRLAAARRTADTNP
jgi:DNA-binding SARP family transcriptional activator